MVDHILKFVERNVTKAVVGILNQFLMAYIFPLTNHPKLSVSRCKLKSSAHWDVQLILSVDLE
jgi:hypothetical protein